MRLVLLFVHVLAAAVWIGGLVVQSHVLGPLARRQGPAPFAAAARRARPLTWTAVALVVLTGFYNVTALGDVERVLASGAALRLAGKFILVLLAVTLAARRDFAEVPRLAAAVADGADPGPALGAVARLDRAVLGLLAVIAYLGLSLSRA